ncbi:MAG: hypothetical protein WEH44_06585 [Pirellulaceae bacterium]
MKLTTLPIRRYRARRLLAATVGSAVSLAMLASEPSARSCAQESSLRSSAERRIWLADERQLPRQTERATHRGFEVSTGPIVVIATTSLQDARRAAEQATAAWNDTAALADHWTSLHRQPNFAQGAVQVVLDGDRARQSDEPLASLARIGRVTQIALGGGDDGASDEQKRQLRQAVSQAFFQTAEMDQTLPEWVSQGLAAYVAGNKTAASSGDDAAATVRFLMEGNDGRYAGPFFDLLRQQLALMRPDPDRDFQRSNGNKIAPAPESEAVEQFVAKLADEYEQWKLDPQFGQPQLPPGDVSDDALVAARNEMLFALKLANRFASQETSVVRTKVSIFEHQRRNSVAVIHAAAARPPSLPALARRITAKDQPTWATIGPDGKLIWSHQEEKLLKLLGVDQQRYQYAWRESRWMLETTLEDGRKLTAWLDGTTENALRPLAKFEVAEPK